MKLKIFFLFAVFSFMAILLVVLAYSTVRLNSQLQATPSFVEFDKNGRVSAKRGVPDIPCPEIGSRVAVIYLLGQSNASNFGGDRFLARDGVYNWYSGSCYQASSPLLGATGFMGEPWSLMGDMLLESGRYDSVVLVPFGVGGSSISDWSSGGRYFEGISLMQSSRLLPLATHIIWHQGETDHFLKTDLDSYQDGLFSLISLLRSYSPDSKVWISFTSLFCDQSTNSISFDNPIRAAQKAFVDSKSLAQVFSGVDTDQLVPFALRYDGCHFGGKALALFAREQANLILGAQD